MQSQAAFAAALARAEDVESRVSDAALSNALSNARAIFRARGLVKNGDLVALAGHLAGAREAGLGDGSEEFSLVGAQGSELQCYRALARAVQAAQRIVSALLQVSWLCSSLALSCRLMCLRCLGIH